MTEATAGSHAADDAAWVQNPDGPLFKLKRSAVRVSWNGHKLDVVEESRTTEEHPTEGIETETMPVWIMPKQLPAKPRRRQQIDYNGEHWAVGEIEDLDLIGIMCIKLWRNIS